MINDNATRLGSRVTSAVDGPPPLSLLPFKGIYLSLHLKLSLANPDLHRYFLDQGVVGCGDVADDLLLSEGDSFVFLIELQGCSPAIGLCDFSQSFLSFFDLPVLEQQQQLLLPPLLLTPESCQIVAMCGAVLFLHL